MKKQCCNTEHKNTFGTVSMVLAIISIVLWFMPYFGLPLAILALIFYNVQKKKDQAALKPIKGTTTSGLVMGIIGVVINSIVLMILLVMLIFFSAAFAAM